MLATELYNDDMNIDAPARFPTDADIEFADRLRRQLEERYLAPSGSSSPTQANSGTGD